MQIPLSLKVRWYIEQFMWAYSWELIYGTSLWICSFAESQSLEQEKTAEIQTLEVIVVHSFPHYSHCGCTCACAVVCVGLRWNCSSALPRKKQLSTSARILRYMSSWYIYLVHFEMVIYLTQPNPPLLYAYKHLKNVPGKKGFWICNEYVPLKWLYRFMHKLGTVVYRSFAVLLLVKLERNYCRLEIHYWYYFFIC